MQDINGTFFTGRLTRDPELRHTPTEKSVTTLRVAIQRPRGQEGQDRGASFWDVQVWNGSAEACSRYLSKGSRVAVVGRLEHDEWDGEDDRPRHKNYIVATQVNFLDPPSEENGAEPATDREPEPAAVAAGGDEDIPL